MVTAADRAKVLDFGLAKFVLPEGDPDPAGSRDASAMVPCRLLRLVTARRIR